MLNWKNSPETQLEGISLAKKINNLSLFIQPSAPPSAWEHCASILFEKSDFELEPYLDELLEWLQDINRPGAMIILERLKKFSGEALKSSLENAVLKSEKMPTEDGLMWLDYLSELLDNKTLISILSKDILALLKKHYHNWASWYNEC